MALTEEQVACRQLGKTMYGLCSPFFGFHCA